ncbi:hypothetical protein BN10_1250019 [Phycicoccus elongatus Lp2]|uniref:Uncharacterized protein n=1 Tax=Phycicoccus elongatus Lp2 TaxID=1193181 RepID=N0DZR8_9MICO|nr:hypothetical protein BN10_1250019 [Phycicoccus elongatus Lp2]
MRLGAAAVVRLEGALAHGGVSFRCRVREGPVGLWAHRSPSSGRARPSRGSGGHGQAKTPDATGLSTVREWSGEGQTSRQTLDAHTQPPRLARWDPIPRHDTPTRRADVLMTFVRGSVDWVARVSTGG